ncbi:MAG: helix-turn-helix domain-containing protein [Gammaproteobacteria bacterium]|nr:helix-turn-helix domain-containing protein [Gammaproteobacteria bacterium]
MHKRKSSRAAEAAALSSADLKRVFTIREACEYLGIGVTTAYELIAEGGLRTFTIGRARRVTRDACDELIAKREAAA